MHALAQFVSLLKVVLVFTESVLFSAHRDPRYRLGGQLSDPTSDFVAQTLFFLLSSVPFPSLCPSFNPRSYFLPNPVQLTSFDSILLSNVFG